eukprot:TRINITY_DN4577_c0_g1_i1.p1 TRINITY_DN4577_c0_g1~~TRINITY_DN4577_c0_g1_i1.p1  ORF type:complete len:400 (+),score=97.83 TRINITY_DN4577_c0_g1_i1:80-1279(+)
MEGGDADEGHRWELGVEATWEAVQERADGTLRIDEIVNADRQQHRRQRHAQAKNVKRGMMRHVVVCVDFSKAMKDDDLPPNRIECAANNLLQFINVFFDQNPISHLSLIEMKSGKAAIMTELNGNMAKHMRVLRQHAFGTVESDKLKGEISLQNTMEVCIKLLNAMPTHATREVIIITSSLTSCDPGNVFETIQHVKSEKVRVSIISLSAQVKLHATIAEETGGSYNVVLDEHHFNDLLLAHTIPPVAADKAQAALVRMAFPSLIQVPVLHKTDKGFRSIISPRYQCPRCLALQLELPTECKSCKLLLVLSPHLARTFHHLFPIAPYKELPVDNADNSNGEPPTKLSLRVQRCAGCSVTLTTSKAGHRYKCTECQQVYCLDCEAFLHDLLHNCPTCLTN